LVLQRATEASKIKPKAPDDARLAELQEWLNGIESAAGADIVPASEDASFRRYFRVSAGGRSCIAMDAPPEQEDSHPFVRVAGDLEAMGLNAPRIIEGDLEKGFLLLTDLGSVHYLEELRRNPAAAAELYAAAIDALIRMQEHGAAYQSTLPPYDEELLRFELSLFHDWLCERHLGLEFGNDDERQWRRLCDLLVANALDQPQVFVHRDYHSRNLMVTEKDQPGILDFQDAVEGPLTYDLVSLLKDCYVSWPEQQVRAWQQTFYEGLDAATKSHVDDTLFQRYFELMGVQRHLKAAGIFARLNHRDGKPGYMADIPRTLGYVLELEARYPELDFLIAWIRDRVLPGLEGTA
jgi:aminoglycoside/choline kinase family phosphotransferase